MKIKTTKSSVSIGINWFLVAFFVFISILAWYHASKGTESVALFLPGYPALGVLSVAATVYSTQAFRIDTQGIWVYYLGIPSRHIYWYEVRGIVLAPYHKGNKKDSIIFMLKNASPFTSQDCASKYCQKNTSQCYCIIIPQNRITEIVSILNNLIWEHIEPISTDAST